MASIYGGHWLEPAGGWTSLEVPTDRLLENELAVDYRMDPDKSVPVHTSVHAEAPRSRLQPTKHAPYR
jgi:hypothetical protein